MTYVAFGDESGIHRRKSPVYGIGCFVLRVEDVDPPSDRLRAILADHGLFDELKWTKIGSYRARSAAALAGIKMLLEADARFDAIVVEKSSYRKWRADREDAFYQTYYQLARHIGQASDGPVELRIDQRYDRYAKRLEVLEIVTNRALAKITESGFVTSVSMLDSKEHPLLQFTDVLVGAVTSDTSLHLDPSVPVNEGKRELIATLGGLVGWPRLCYDTFPNRWFNVWHFPIEFRNRPGTRSVLSPQPSLR